MVTASERGPGYLEKRKGNSDCLSKTQDSAKLKEDVNCLMPARCPRMKAGSESKPTKLRVNGGHNSDGPKVAKFLVT